MGVVGALGLALIMHLDFGVGLEAAVFTVAAAFLTLSTWHLVVSDDVTSWIARADTGATPRVREIAASNPAEVLRSLAHAAQLRDFHTHGHSQRVAFNACRIGEALGLTPSELIDIRWAAVLHDIGKAGVPEALLSKPGLLSTQEFETVKRHSQIGADLLSAASDSLKSIARLVLTHHERWDGAGYPCGLSGTDIPLGARIIAVADVFEALTSERPYRAPVSESEAVAVVSAGSGTHFDPDVVTIFEWLYEQRKLSSTSTSTAAGSAPRPDYAIGWHTRESMSSLLLPLQG